MEPRELGLMNRNPRPQNEGVLTLRTSVLVVIQGLILSVITFTVYYISQHYGVGNVPTLREQRSLAFVLLTFMQLEQSFLSRSVELSIFRVGLLGNKILVWAFLLSVFLMLLGVYVPGEQSADGSKCL